MGKAEDLADDLMRHPLMPEEIAARYPQFPELRLRADAPAVVVDEATRVRDVVGRLQSEDVGSIALRNPDGGVTAMVVPVERYLELVGTQLATDPNKVATLDGRLMPSEVSIAASYVEQVNPRDTWGRPIPGYDPNRPAPEQ